MKKEIYEEIGQCIWHRKWQELLIIVKKSNGLLDLKRIIDTPYGTKNSNILTGLLGAINDSVSDLEEFKERGDQERVAEMEKQLTMIAAVYRRLMEKAKGIDANEIFAHSQKLLLSELLHFNQLEIFDCLIKKLDSPIEASLIDKKDMSDPEQTRQAKILLLLSDLNPTSPKRLLQVKPNGEDEDKSNDEVVSEELEDENYYSELVATLKQLRAEIRIVFDSFSEPATNQGLNFFKSLNTDSKFMVCHQLFKHRGFGDVPFQYIERFIKTTAKEFYSQCGQTAVQTIAGLVVEEFMNSGLCKTANVTEQHQKRYKNVITKELERQLKVLKHLSLDRLRPKFLIDVKNALISYASTAEDLRKNDILAISSEVFGKVVNNAPRTANLPVMVQEESFGLRGLFGNN